MIQRVAKLGGRIETIAGDVGDYPLLQSDGRFVYAGRDGDILRGDGLDLTPVLTTRQAYPRFAVSNGDIYWIRDVGRVA